MKCPRCQQENPTSLKFCGECGAPLQEASPTAESYADLKARVERLTGALSESFEQQTASGKILRVIASSPTDLQPVLDAVAQSAARLCNAYDAGIFRVDGNVLRLAAHHGPLAAPAGLVVPLIRGSAAARAVIERRTFQVADLQAEVEEFPEGSGLARRFGYRTTLNVPLVREGVAIGVIVIRRSEVRPFAGKQVELVTTFADQAVIAIENVRLFNETKEALERQTATSEILRVISSSPTDVQPVFDTIAESAVRLCEAAFGAVVRFDGEWINIAALSGLRPDEREAVLRYFPTRPSPDGPGLSRVVLKGEAVHIQDVQVDPKWRAASAGPAFSAVEGFRTFLAVPLIREGLCLGAVNVWRREVSPFSEQHITLLKTFADQAVIAIENVRLFMELQEKNRALTEAHAQVSEALDQQTATAEILRVISSSPTDVQPVFEAIAQSAVGLCKGFFGAVFRYEDVVSLVATCNVPQEGLEELRRMYPGPPAADTAPGRALLTRAVVHIRDQANDEEFSGTVARASGYRTNIAVPMLRNGQPIGAIAVARGEVQPFSETEIQLLRTFADQAVIAIENVRLFNETKEALEQQTATAEILQVISGSPTDLQPVFDTIAARATRLCDARECAVFRFDGELIHLVAQADTSATWAPALRSAFPRPPGRGSITARAIETRSVVHIPDVLADPDFDMTEAARISSIRSVLSVPMIHEGKVIGAITVDRREPKPFLEKQIELVRIFADQAVIAIENVRLFKELEAKNASLTEALDQQTATGDILRIISSSPTDVQPVFDSIVRSAVRLLDGHSANVLRVSGDELQLAAMTAVNEAADAETRATFPVGLTTAGMAQHVVRTRRSYIVADIETDSLVTARPRHTAPLRGFRSMVTVPMVHQEQVIGVISVTRRLAGAFSEDEVALLQTFADQAVIAIENVRLFKELQTSNRELPTALDTQTATSDILRVISRSQTDVQPVFDAILNSAVRLLWGYSGALTRIAGDQIELATLTRTDDAGEAAAKTLYPEPLQSEGAHAQAIRDRAPLNTADAHTDPRLPDAWHALARIRGFQSMAVVPLLRRDEAVGTIVVTRREPGGFNDDEIALLKT